MKIQKGEFSPTYKHGHYLNRKHSPEYEAYHGMKARCYNKNKRGFKDYGGRGIKMCDTWLGENGFVNFLKDMGLRPSKNYSIDRIDNTGNYEPSNVRWATKSEQSRNNRRSWEVLVNGSWVSTIEAAKILSVAYSSLVMGINGTQALPKRYRDLVFRRKY